MSLNTYYKTKSIDRMLDIIEYFSPANMESGVSEISRNLNIHKSTVHRLLTCLESRGYVVKNDDNSRYKLSLKFVELGFMVLDNMKIQKEVHGAMEHLAARTQKTVHLSVESGNEAMYLHKVENPNNIVRYSKIGKTMPLYCTAMGKVMLSGFSEQELQNYFSGTPLKKLTDHTLTDPERLLNEIEIVRRKGYALDREEVERGLQCIGVPVINGNGRIVAALSLSAMTNTFENVTEIVKELKAAAQEVSAYMSYYDQGRRIS